jgi:flavin-binding protein dodecin
VRETTSFGRGDTGFGWERFRRIEEGTMAEIEHRTYKLIELVGASNESYADATQNAVSRAGETLKGLGWFQVTELRGMIQNGEISEYQVTLKVGFRLLDSEKL